MMSERKAEKDKVVYALSSPSRCHNCDRRLDIGEIVKLREENDDKEAYCRTCSQLDKLEMLPAGNAVITRLARKYSSVSFAIVKWSEIWKCYERQGTLVEPAAIDKAESESGIKLAKREHCK
jgi:hypothetical protein